MSKLCAWAAQSESGSVDGQPGDSTGKEVLIGDWYSFGQDAVYRFKNKYKKIRKEAASLAGGIANNDCVGYGQSDRLSFFRQWGLVDYDISRLNTNCNTDCSAFIGAILNALGISVSPSVTTFNMDTELMATGMFDKFTGAEYLNSDAKLMAGDIVNNSQAHVIMVIDNVPPATGPIPPHSGGGGSGTGDILLFLMARYIMMNRKRG